MHDQPQRARHLLAHRHGNRGVLQNVAQRAADRRTVGRQRLNRRAPHANIAQPAHYRVHIIAVPQRSGGPAGGSHHARILVGQQPMQHFAAPIACYRNGPRRQRPPPDVRILRCCRNPFARDHVGSQLGPRLHRVHSALPDRGIARLQKFAQQRLGLWRNGQRVTHGRPDG